MNSPRISIVTPSFNQAAFIEQTIGSVLDQGYPNLEYIVIDGGSTDGSVDVIRKYADRLTYWVSEPDRGQTHAINKGFERATGEIRAWLNSDDFYLPGALNRIADAFMRQPEADVVYGRIRYVSQQGLPQETHSGRLGNFADIADVWGVWWQKRQFVQPEVFWRRRIAEACGPLKEDLHYVMDYEYWLRMASKAARFVHLPEEVAAFRRTDVQKSNASDKVAREHLHVLSSYLWDSTVPLTRSQRWRLQGNWLFDVGFRSAADRCVERGVSPVRRWLELAGEVVRHPQLIASPLFRSRMAHWARGRRLVAAENLK